MGGFADDVVFDNLPSPIDVAFAPDGRIFLASKLGSVYVIKDGALLPTPFITLPVNTFWDRGLQSIVLDPNFETNGYVYLYYTHENNPDDYTGLKTGQLIRVTADGDIADPDSTLVLLGTEVGNPATPSCQDYPAGTDCLVADGVSHVGGGLSFAADGSLLFATGDGSIFPTSVPVELAWRSQDLDSLAGKLLRIDPSTGAGLPDNPFFTGNPTDNQSKVWSYGFRNPFRIAVDPATGTWLVGDVGSSYWEEINVAEPGADYGWPCYEGAAEHPTQSTYVLCQSLFTGGPPNTHPLYSYAGPSAALIAGVLYHGSNYPSDFDGAFFFSDYVRHTISFLPMDPNTDQLLPDGVQQLFATPGAPVDFEVGPDGDIYYLAWDGASPYGQLRHISFIEGNRAPVASVSAMPLGGLASLSVQFNSKGSFDPDGDDISFAWDFGDGGSSDEASPMHVYTDNGTYKAQLHVSDADITSSATVTVIVGNQPPIATINAPAPNSPFGNGQAVPFSGSGYDAETGTLSGSHLHWTVVLHHCYIDVRSCHSHPYLDKAGGGGTLITPFQSFSNEFFYLDLHLTVTDNAGLSDIASVEIGPDSDGDGLLDEAEMFVAGTDYLSPDSDGDGCSDGRELGPTAYSGGQRDPLNPWDYMNPSHDGKNRIDDILLVVQAYFKDDNDGNPGLPPYATGYNPDTDRTLVGPPAWNLGPPNGLQRVDDILNALHQYFHDCS